MITLMKRFLPAIALIILTGLCAQAQTLQDSAAATYSINGQVRLNTAGLGGVTLTLTSPVPAGFTPRKFTTTSNGNYSFASLPEGRTYKITPSKINYTFTPSSRSYSNLSANQTGQNFAAILKKYSIRGRVVARAQPTASAA